MSCNSNNSGCAFPVTSSNCVSYQGEPVPILGICKGQNLSCLMEIILEQLVAVTDGSGIVLSEITSDCDFISTQLAGKNKSLFNLIQVLINSSCTLKELIDNLSLEVNTPNSYDLKGIIEPTSNSTPGVLQGTINELYILYNTVGNITSGLGNNSIQEAIDVSVGNALINKISSPTGITSTGSGNSAQINIVGIVPPYCPIPCFAPLANWESNGKGKVGTQYEGWIIVGTNGTSQFDMRGYTFAGATNIPGINFDTSLQSTVNPITNGDPDYGTSIGNRKGQVKHQLSTSELPSFSVTGTTEPHSHTLENTQLSVPAGESYQSYNVLTDNGNGIQVSPETVDFTSDSVGQGVKHENRQPTIYGYFIMRLS